MNNQTLSDLVSDDGTRVSRRVFGDETLYKEELRRVFHKSWLYLAHESEIPNVGDYVSATMGETPVIVTRGKGNKVHALLNACRHRGVAVCRANRGNTRAFVCPYHAWTYGIDGRFMGAPFRKEAYPDDFDNKDWGLVPVAKVASYCGLIFGTFDEEAESLDDHLGDMRYYLDVTFDRRAGGVEILGPPQKWILESNWKLPAENQVGDNYHAGHLHGTFVSQPAYDEILDIAQNVCPKRGHGLGLRIMPEGTAPTSMFPGCEGIPGASPVVREYYEQVYAETQERLGELRARMRPLSHTVFPNFSLLHPTYTVRVSHPRGSHRAEIWSWAYADKDAPDEVKDQIRKGYMLTFGPSGTLEKEDGEAWQQQVIGNKMEVANDYPYYYGMGIGTERRDEHMPGLIGPALSEHPQRNYYLAWREAMERGGALPQ